MSAPSHGQDARTEQSGKRRRRKDRAASRAPEPKQIVSGAGQPLDASVRRELEEALGHDLGRVRLHTDRDADALTGLLGADAVAVGQDVFFRDGAYVPGTAEGRRLLAHELLHTVQNQDGLGALRAGRDLGAVSLPQQAVEREAEAAARDFVRDGDGQAAQAVEEGRAATPGWLRYATVDADRTRLERIDPATLVDRLAASVARSLRGDPEDRSQRTRRQLVRLPDELLEDVLARLESRLLTSEHERLLDLVEEAEAGDTLDPEPLAAPPVENDLFDEVEYARETERRRAEEERDREQRTGPSTAPETAPGRRDGAGDGTREDEERHDPSGDGPGRQPGSGTDPGPAEQADGADGADGAEREPGQAPAPAAGAGQRTDEGEQASGGGPGQQAGPGQDGGAGTAPGGGVATEPFGVDVPDGERAVAEAGRAQGLPTTAA
ncbi:DUF4157 domain-containing protein, partial [Streptomyces zhihengii]|uniref:eCIS core domain-containing protein n=1 Tax=Streptomyces zhihengii TaxID=1818004 RepID=UPI003456F5FF